MISSRFPTQTVIFPSSFHFVFYLRVSIKDHTRSIIIHLPHQPTHQTNTSHINMDQSFRRIGQGFCGTVWASSGSGNDRAIKREDGGPGRSLHNDYIMHQNILKGLSTSHCQVRIPNCHQFVSGNDSWWDDHLSSFPKEFRTLCNVLVTDRIPPFPKLVRDTIIDLYCPKLLKSSIKLSEPDQDCLIRPYLGRRRRLLSKQSKFQAFSLRNYPLHIDQIEELALDSLLLARIMAETLAEIYWRAHVDANDIEFVLAPMPTGHTNESNAIITSGALGDHLVWILDFDCCKQMSMDEKGVNQAVAAFYKNDPFYPRPGRDNIKDQALWIEFKTRFIEASRAILHSKSSEAFLPTLWVDLVEQRGQT